MIAEGERLQWRWIVAAVSPRGEIFMLDPGKALSRKEVTLTEKARIANLLLISFLPTVSPFVSMSRWHQS
jgi:hypothetical protein